MFEKLEKWGLVHRHLKYKAAVIGGFYFALNPQLLRHRVVLKATHCFRTIFKNVISHPINGAVYTLFATLLPFGLARLCLVSRTCAFGLVSNLSNYPRR